MPTEPGPGTVEVGPPKKRPEPAGLREGIAFALAERGISEHRACRLGAEFEPAISTSRGRIGAEATRGTGEVAQTDAALQLAATVCGAGTRWSGKEM